MVSGQVGIPVEAEGLRRVYSVLYGMAMADGHLEDRERAVLDAYRDWFEISPEEADELERRIDRGEAVKLGQTPAELELVRDGMLDVAAADKLLDPHEEHLFLTVGRATGLRTHEIQGRLRWRGRSLSADAIGADPDPGPCCPSCGRHLSR